MKTKIAKILLAILLATLVVNANADGSLERVHDAGVLVVGIEGEYPPFNYFEGDQLAGFDVEISNEVAQRLGVAVEFVPTSWDGIVIGLLNRQYDTVISSLAITPERSARVTFTQPYYRSGGQVVVPLNSPITEVEEIKGRRVGAALGTTYADQVEDYGAVLVLYDDDLQSLPDVVAGRLDAGVSDKLVVLLAIQERGYQLRLLDDMLFTEEVGIAVRQSDLDLRDAIDSALEAMFEDGTYSEISNRWFGSDIR